jgi:hypothetical protein
MPLEPVSWSYHDFFLILFLFCHSEHKNLIKEHFGGQLVSQVTCVHGHLTQTPELVEELSLCIDNHPPTLQDALADFCKPYQLIEKNPRSGQLPGISIVFFFSHF